MLRIDTHHHVIQSDHRKALARSSLLEAGGRALVLFPRLGAAPQPISRSPVQRIRHTVSRSVLRGVARLTSTG